MRATVIPGARCIEPTDALVRLTRAAIHGRDLWPYTEVLSSSVRFDRRSNTGEQLAPGATYQFQPVINRVDPLSRVAPPTIER